MPPRRAGRKYWIAAGSLAVHAAILAALAVYAPRLKVPEWKSGPPQAVIPVLIMPKALPPAAEPGAKPTPIRLHRRPQRFMTEPPPVAPLITPEEEARRAAPSPAPPVIRPPGPEEAVAARARKALRGRVGCANPNAVGLTRAEREACERRFSAGAKNAEFPGLGIDADKAAGLDAAAARRQQDYNYKRGVRPPAPPTPGAGWDKDRGPPGQAEAMGAASGNDRPSLKVPF